jgi:hypothetical protein
MGAEMTANKLPHRSSLRIRRKFQIGLEGMAEPLNIELVAGKDDVVDIRQPFESGGKLYYGKSGFRVAVEDLPKLAAALLVAYDDLTGATLQLHSWDEDEDSEAQDHMMIAAADFGQIPQVIHKWEVKR